MDKRIRALLLLKNITSADIARELGVSRTWMSLVVNGHKKSDRIRKNIANKLSMTVEELWPANDKGQKSTPLPPPVRLSSPQAAGDKERR